MVTRLSFLERAVKARKYGNDSNYNGGTFSGEFSIGAFGGVLLRYWQVRYGVIVGRGNAMMGTASNSGGRSGWAAEIDRTGSALPFSKHDHGPVFYNQFVNCQPFCVSVFPEIPACSPLSNSGRPDSNSPHGLCNQPLWRLG